MSHASHRDDLYVYLLIFCLSLSLIGVAMLLSDARTRLDAIEKAFAAKEAK